MGNGVLLHFNSARFADSSTVSSCPEYIQFKSSSGNVAILFTVNEHMLPRLITNYLGIWGSSGSN